MRLSEEELKKILEKGHAKIRDCSSVCFADIKQNIGNESLGKKKIARFNRPVDIEICNYRHRLADRDGICSKYLIDGLVDCGILHDDTTKEIVGLKIKQIKIPKQQCEKTIVIIAGA